MHLTFPKLEQAFPTAPDATSARAKLKIGAWPDGWRTCQNTKDASVQRCESSTSLLAAPPTAETVWRVDGADFKNVRATVYLGSAAGSAGSLRNPPVFLDTKDPHSFRNIPSDILKYRNWGSGGNAQSPAGSGCLP